MTQHLDATPPADKRRRGAQPGNTLAWKTGRYRKEMREMDEMFRSQRRQIRAEVARVLAMVEAARKCERAAVCAAARSEGDER